MQAPGGPNSFNIIQFLGKFGKIMLVPPQMVGAPPWANPGSTIDVCTWGAVHPSLKWRAAMVTAVPARLQGVTAQILIHQAVLESV